ncbi:MULTISPECIES: glycosyltransferase [unclassified Pseudoalteromonas]|uniref:glycosyltransferase n=1 Tax=unclassified Pseudoalteromonas TaxID=194690 RepID=UPI00110BA710|nr:MULTISPECIES: glycosyltransferase [unclassified Pseudoalteromonas]TMP49542.1 hypothetical protein CWB80_00040 [Pseudoalteromonas sp. S1650]TMP64428.1 hypothetical protein CWB79_20800 [Pseudoalteromonas sp. S1649]
MSFKSLNYLGLVDVDSAVGVAKKIKNTVDASNALGVDSNAYFFKTDFKGLLSFLKSLAKCRSDIVVIRFNDLVFPLVFFILIYLRLKNKRVIIDIPTPRVIGLQEISVLIKNPIYRVFRKGVSYLSGSWVLFPANLIIQYADEGRWFKLGLTDKTLKMGNGILVRNESTVLRNSVWPANELKLVAVANISNWHGFDRVLKAIAVTNNLQLPYRVTFTLIGEGDELNNLRKLSQTLGVEKNIHFIGKKVGGELSEILAGSHVGISSLGLFRKGLNEASDLKTREYMLSGLPVIGVGVDPDFHSECKFRYVIPNDDSIESLIQLIKSFEKTNFSTPREINKFAHSHLSLEAKVEKIFLTLS